MYRPPARHPRSQNGYRRTNGNLRRLALMRARGKPKPTRSSAGLIGLLSLLFVLFLATGLVASGAAAAGVALVTLDSMDDDLPDVTRFEDLDFAQPSVVYDRTGTIELARFQSELRRVVRYDEIPKLVLDAHTSVEDRTFWENEGYDPNAIMAAILENVANVRERGASTITQQLVRARLLPQEVLEGDQYTRKIKEILQARNLTLAFPGEDGKERIITAYLNQVYYGHNAYGIAAAAEVYFGITDLSQLTPAQAALLAGLPQAPDTYDLFRWAETDAGGRLVVPTVAAAGEELPAPVERRNYILNNLAEGFGRWTELSEEDLEQALNEPIVLATEEPLFYKAPHFIWHLKPQLDALLVDRAPLEHGGYKIITSLDMRAQGLAERYITAGTIYTQLSREELEAVIAEQSLEADAEWLLKLRGKDIHNGALVAIDARTGDILAYVGSAGYYRGDLASDKFRPKFDVAGQGYRQSGSAWKPFVYVAGFDTRTITPGTLLPDVTTEFAPGWAPGNADLRERGPVLMREALRYSLNPPVIRAQARVGTDEMIALAERLGLTFQHGSRQIRQADLAGAIGTVETRLLELTAGFGALANGGNVTTPRGVLEIYDSQGQRIYDAGQPAPREAMSEQAAWLMTDILKENTDPEINEIWGHRLQVVNGPAGERRPAAAKTGTTDLLKDLSVYGYLAAPADATAPHIVTGVWMGNSDQSPPLGGDAPVLAADAPGRVWQSFLRDYTSGLPIADFPPPPPGLVRATIDAWSGGAPGPWTRDTIDEWFIEGTQPGAPGAVDPDGILYREMCAAWYVDLTQVEPEAPETWQEALADWMSRARQGRGVRGEHGTRTDYLVGEQDWGGPIAPLVCTAPPPLPPGPIPPGTTPAPGVQPTPAPNPPQQPKPRERDDDRPDRPPDRPRPRPSPPPEEEPTPVPDDDNSEPPEEPPEEEEPDEGPPDEPPGNGGGNGGGNGQP